MNRNLNEKTIHTITRTLIITAIALNIADFITTYLGVEYFQIANELNPLGWNFFFKLWKIISVFGLVGLLYAEIRINHTLFDKYIIAGTIIFNIAYAFAIINNSAVLLKGLATL
jgi:hypothetical protein